MNHWKIFLTALFLTALVLNAIEVKTPSITAELSPDGAVITSLSVKGKRCDDLFQPSLLCEI